MTTLSDQDRTELHYMLIANRNEIGLYGPTVRKFGRVAAVELLIERGLARHGSPSRAVRDPGGYWITGLGREALDAK